MEATAGRRLCGSSRDRHIADPSEWPKVHTLWGYIAGDLQARMDLSSSLKLRPRARTRLGADGRSSQARRASVILLDELVASRVNCRTNRFEAFLLFTSP